MRRFNTTFKKWFKLNAHFSSHYPRLFHFEFQDFIFFLTRFFFPPRPCLTHPSWLFSALAFRCVGSSTHMEHFFPKLLGCLSGSDLRHFISESVFLQQIHLPPMLEQKMKTLL